MLAAVTAALKDRQRALRELDKLDCTDSLRTFMQRAWHCLEPGVEFTSGWAVDATCEHLEAVTKGQIRRLLINIPPGCTKSMTVNVMWPAWEWGPRGLSWNRFISAGYELGLPVRDLVRCRDLIRSEWFQERWPLEFKDDQDQKTYYENKRTGWRKASSVGSSLIGYRGDRIIIDDPHSVQKVESEVDRETALRWFAETVPTRLNKQDESAIVVIMQRVHERDISGFILAKELGYEHLCLPMEYEKDHPFRSTRFTDPRRLDGELLWPERFSREAVESNKKTFRAWGGSYAEAGQLQQRPAPRGGGMFQRKDFKFMDRPPESAACRVRAWDLAATEEGDGAYTVGLKMSVSEGTFYIEDVFRQRLSPLGVKQSMRQLAEQDGHGTIVDGPQDPGQAGKYQKADLAFNLAGFDCYFSPESGSKEDRARPFAAQVEAGNVVLVRGPWVDDFINEAIVFPNGEFKDQIDAASRAFGRLLISTPDPVALGPELLSIDED